MNSRKTLQAVIDHYGADHQLAKAIEEQTELIHVIARRLQFGEGGWNFVGFYEELADVYVMLDQLKLIYCAEMSMTLGDLNDRLDSCRQIKLKRTIKRMQGERQ